MDIPFGKPALDDAEKSAVMDVLDGPLLVHGPRATRFEQSFADFCGAPHAISVSSCTAGMHLVYFAMGLGPGDAVIVPAQTHAATAHAVAFTGATPVFVDAESHTGNIDIARIEGLITEQTKAIAIVHYLGLPVDMAKIMEIARKHDLLVLEDCALAVGSYLDGVHAGLHGDVGVFSFYPVKHITTAEGGMVITRHQDLADKIRLKKAFGVDKSHGERAIPGVYDVIDLGYNYRMSEVHAAIGIEQMKKVPDFLKQREANHAALASGLAEIGGIHLFPDNTERMVSSRYCLSARLSERLSGSRPALMSALKKRGVGTSVYYPHPVPRMTYYRTLYGYDEQMYRNAAIISDTSVALPVGPHLDETHMKYIVSAMKESVREICK